MYSEKIITVCNAVYFRLCIDLMHIPPPVTAEGFDGSHHPRFAECLDKCHTSAFQRFDYYYNYNKMFYFSVTKSNENHYHHHYHHQQPKQCHCDIQYNQLFVNLLTITRAETRLSYLYAGSIPFIVVDCSW